ncbi:probable protein arginine n-methyltransferase 3 [Phtheirospermum japonicum]|uniref:Probable protein arginine n-methyltransferase 3 n=1 Tax=Phtheirospermum japonicum TaxID=374723 RepID=A0A830CB67_9LAMI|nr:probable protein arginine n-methyltransferase 3 [Phtheirospermum japonicum]
MTTHLLEMEDRQNEAQVNALRHFSDSDSEEELEDHNWDDWKDDAVEEQGLNLQLLCLFCDSSYGSCSSLFEHCASAHTFDFYGIKKAYHLDFYKCFKLINYVRSQVAVNICWSCGTICMSKEELQKHFHKAVNFDGSSFPWDDDRYLNPFLQDDSLLYSFGEDDDEEGDTMCIDKDEMASYMSQFEHIDIHDEGRAPMLENPCENGEKDDVLLSFDDNDTSAAKTLEGVTVDNTSRNRRNKTYDAPSLKIAANEIKNINKNYFNSYSSFGIHRDMISDKVRTDAYRQAILENPSLLRNAVVMDVGCGTGILSLFAAQAGASRVIAVEASDKMAAVATEIAKDNSLLRNGVFSEGSQQNGVIEVIQAMVEEIDNATNQIPPQSVDVLFSEWMGYCLLYESMLTSVLYARDKWLKPGGAILPDTATMFVAGFGKGATSIPFWENVYGFNMACIGREVVEDAARVPIIDVIDSCDIVTTTKVLQAFDLVTMQPKQMDFTAEVELEQKLNNSTGSTLDDITWCYGLVLWFETGFTERFCREKPVMLSTSPYDPSTHWSQTILTFREPVPMTSNKVAAVGGKDCPAVKIQSRISIVRGSQHRSIDISIELKGIGSDGQIRTWPVQIYNLN